MFVIVIVYLPALLVQSGIPNYSSYQYNSVTVAFSSLRLFVQKMIE